jgi:hypothetical protein
VLFEHIGDIDLKIEWLAELIAVIVDQFVVVGFGLN